MLVPVQSLCLKGASNEAAQAVGYARVNDEVIRSVLLQHEPHCFHILRSPASVAVNASILWMRFMALSACVRKPVTIQVMPWFVTAHYGKRNMLGSLVLDHSRLLACSR